MHAALFRGLRLAASAVRDHQTYHLSGFHTRVSKPRIVHGHPRADDRHTSAAFPAYLEPFLVPAIRRDPGHPQLGKLRKGHALRGHGIGKPFGGAGEGLTTPHGAETRESRPYEPPGAHLLGKSDFDTYRDIFGIEDEGWFWKFLGSEPGEGRIWTHADNGERDRGERCGHQLGSSFAAALRAFVSY